MELRQKEKGPIGKLFNACSDALKRVFESKTRRDRDRPPGAEPYANSLVRNRRGPNGRSGAVALAEPDDE
jgi:hypothetical protein